MKSRKAEKELSASLQRDPTQAEIADKVGITEQRLHELRKVMLQALTLTLAPCTLAELHTYAPAFKHCTCVSHIWIVFTP